MPAANCWRLFRTLPAAGAENMAIDAAILAHASRTGECVLRVYEWNEPTLSLGRHQPAADTYDRERARLLGVAFVRRPTGGRAVLHHREITYSIAAPDGALGTLGESYQWINRLLLDALRLLGVDARCAPSSSPAPAPGLAPCFDSPVSGEIEVGGRKLCGSAQVRERGALLQHGSLLVDDDQWLAAVLLREPASLPPHAATLRSVLGEAPSAARVMCALARALGAQPNVTVEQWRVTEQLARESASARVRFENDDWTWRR